MKTFNNFDAFANHLQKVISEYKAREFKVLDFLGKVIQEESKHKIGHIQVGGGPFSNWQDLAESTKNDKQRRGYVFNSEHNPLYRTGHLQNSISHIVNRAAHRVHIGSPLDEALYQEEGTANIPARSFLGLTMFKEKYFIKRTLSLFLSDWIAGQRMQLRRIL
jgi:hypothetical protein